MTTFGVHKVAAPSLPSGEYALKTGKDGLIAVAGRLITSSAIAAVIDIPGPEDVGAWDLLLESTDHLEDGRSEEEWAFVAIQIMNAVRLRCPDGKVPGAFPGAISFLLRCPPAVAWFALRNSTGWESSNRASGPAPGVGWYPMIPNLFKLDDRWFQLFVNIRNSKDFSS